MSFTNTAGLILLAILLLSHRQISLLYPTEQAQLSHPLLELLDLIPLHPLPITLRLILLLCKRWLAP